MYVMQRGLSYLGLIINERYVGLLYNGSDKTVRNRIIVLTYFKLDTKGVRSGLPIRGSRDCKHLIRRTLVITSTAYNVDIGYMYARALYVYTCIYYSVV